jgi:AraC family transcriptional regulator, transcriptional activator FtrA
MKPAQADAVRDAAGRPEQTEQRVMHARELLEPSTLPVEEVARQCGLGAAANFRRHFSTSAGVSPSVYRRAFSDGG